MGARLFIVLAISFQAVAGWSGLRALDSSPSRPTIQPSDNAPCEGAACCCGFTQCPCAGAPAPPEQSHPQPATPPGRDRPEAPRIAPSATDLDLLGVADTHPIPRTEHAATHHHPLGVLARRTQQLQCVWLT